MWNIIKLNTNNGIRIGITEEDEYEILETCVNEIDSDRRSKELSDELNIKMFDNNIDEER